MNKKFLDATSNLEFVFEEETRNSLINVSALPAVGPQPLVPAWGGVCGASGLEGCGVPCRWPGPWGRLVVAWASWAPIRMKLLPGAFDCLGRFFNPE